MFSFLPSIITFLDSARFSDLPNYFASRANEYDKIGKGEFPTLKSFVLVNGKQMDRFAVFAKVIELNPDAISYSQALTFHNLATCLPPGESRKVIIDGKKENMDQRQLYKKAIILATFYAPAYANLATCLEDSDTVDIITENGTINFTKRQLYQRAIALTSSGLVVEQLYGRCTRAYNNLGELLDSDERIEVIIKGHKILMNAQQLFLHAILLGARTKQTFLNLAATLQEEEEIGVTINGHTSSMSALDLRQRAKLFDKANEVRFF